MANAYSIQRNRQGWIDPTDQDFTLKALMFKQQKYDANQAKVASVIENYKSLQLARGVDRDYLNERIRGLVDNVNQYGAQDFSSNAVTQSIQYHIGQALDENVMTAVQETAKIKAYQTEVQRIKEKDPKAYNQLNEAFGMAPAQEYMQNEEVGAKISGSLAYTPFKDIEGEVNTWLTEIQKNSKDGVTSMPDPENPGRMIEVTLNGKSANELRQLAMGYMGDRYNDQIKVNVWGSTGGFKNIEPQAAQAVEAYDKVIGAKSSELVEIQAKLTGLLSDEDKNIYKEQAKQLQNDINEHSQMKNAMQTNPVASLIYLEKNKISNRSGLALGMLQTKSVQYKKDDYFFAQLDTIREDKKLELAYQVAANDAAYKAEDTRIKQGGLELKNKELEMKAAGLLGGSSSDGTSDGTSGGGIGIQGGAVLEEVGLEEGEETQKSYRQMWEGDIQDKYTKFSEFNVQSMQAVMDIASGKMPSDPSKVTAAKAAIAEFTSKGGKLDATNPNNAVKFMNTLARADAYSALNIIPVGGKNVSVKQQFQDLNGQFVSASNKYKQAKLAAQKAEAGGMKRPFGDNEYFEQVARENVPFSVSKVLNLDVTTKNKGQYNKLISMSEEIKGSGGFLEVKDNMPIKIRPTKDGNYSVTYFAATKDDDKQNMTAPITVTVSAANAKKMIPQLEMFNQPTKQYTINSMGTKPLISPKIKFDSPNSEDHFYKYETIKNYETSKLDTQFIDEQSAKNTIISGTGISNLKGEPLATMNDLVSKLLSPTMLNKYTTSVYYGYSANSESGIGYSSITAQNGEKVATVNMGPKDSLDNFVKMNQWSPQVTYSKIVMNEIKTMMDNYTSTGKLEATPAIKKMMANG